VTARTTRDEQPSTHRRGQKTTNRYAAITTFPRLSTGDSEADSRHVAAEVGHGALASGAAGSPALRAFRIRWHSRTSRNDVVLEPRLRRSLALFDAGRARQAACAGIEWDDHGRQSGTAILTDILGTEDHLGDMDFKVAGTRGCHIHSDDISQRSTEGIAKALRRPRRTSHSRRDAATMAQPRSASKWLPPHLTIQIRPTRSATSSSQTRRSRIQEQTGAEINLDDTGGHSA